MHSLARPQTACTLMDNKQSRGGEEVVEERLGVDVSIEKEKKEKKKKAPSCSLL